jgi:hypothetical protein
LKQTPDLRNFSDDWPRSPIDRLLTYFHYRNAVLSI